MNGWIGLDCIHGMAWLQFYSPERGCSGVHFSNEGLGGALVPMVTSIDFCYWTLFLLTSYTIDNDDGVMRLYMFMEFFLVYTHS